MVKSAAVSFLQLIRTTISSGKDSNDLMDPARSLAVPEEACREESARTTKLKDDVDRLIQAKERQITENMNLKKRKIELCAYINSTNLLNVGGLQSVVPVKR